ncbi:MAG: F0F1 ATP synthase subunit A [Acidobacteria bacterium]|nr:F0F1 ATP synthase subunit A [Acidobacteriota bacterium]MBI3424238.1 F0F1 ATP synthase subunit A [Acidobacteriota bacterium]
MALLNFLQEHGAAQPAAEHGAAAAQHGEAAVEAAGHAVGAASHEHVPIIVEKLNDVFGPAIFNLQAQIMPPIYKAFHFGPLKVFGDHWPGEGKSYEQYRAAGELPLPTHVVMFLFVVVIAVVVLTILRGKLSTENPTTKQQTFEVGVEAIRGFLNDLVGPGSMKHFPVVATFAVLILISNLTGMLPDMVAPTANFNMTLALALTSFLYYNYVGIRENGLGGHLKHLAGPVPWLAFLMFPIELVSNLARILTLSMRLFGNIYGEEQVSGSISAMMQWGVPALLMPLGLLTSVLQAFIFILLSMFYLGEVSHHSDEQHGEAHGEAHAAAH